MIDPTPLRSLGAVPGVIVDPTPPQMTPRQAGLVPPGGFPVQPDIIMQNGQPARLGIITPDITRSLGQPMALGDATVMGIPLKTWLIVVGGATLGATAGAYMMTRDGKGAVGGAVGGALGALFGMVAVNLMGPPRLESQVA